MKKLFTTKNLALMAIFAAIAAILMVLIEIPVVFIAPSFYKLDFSEIPILIGTFIMGPVSGIIMEAIKIVLKILLKGTTTGYVGELANFCIGCCLVVPAGIIYKFKKSKKGAFIGIVVGIVLMAVGYLLLAIPSKTPVDNKMLYLVITCASLFVIAFGNGLFKGNLQALVGQMYDNPQYASMRDSGFSLFYMFINIGAIFAPCRRA